MESQYRKATPADVKRVCYIVRHTKNVIYPDYLKDRVTEQDNLVEIPSHGGISKNPFERVEVRYGILENLI